MGPDRAGAGTIGMHITAQDLYNHTRCAHRVYLDAHGDEAERSEASPFVRLLWEMGLQAERQYLGSLGELPYEDLQALPLEAAAARTSELMAGGAALIYQGVIRAGDWIGRPDLLLKREDASSRFGDYHYEPIDIKAGRGWEERDGRRRFKQHYAFQILFYRRILQQLQGRATSIGRIINVDMELEQFEVVDFEPAFERALAEVTRLVAGAESSEPVLGSHCHLCHWYRHCRRWVEGSGDPSGLYFVGKAKFELKRVGLGHIRDIAAMDVDDYVEGPKKVRGIGRKTLVRTKERARVRVAGVPALRAGYVLPAAAREVYFDIEDDPTRGLTYLFGLIVREGTGAAGAYRYFLARRPDQEEEVVRAFWGLLGELGDAVFYVYSRKERSTLKRLMQRYALDEAVFQRYLEQEYDLYTELVVRHSDWPTYSYGVKQIAGLIGFKWRDPDPSGANSIVWYNEHLNDPARTDLIDRILGYNEDDCRAMIAIKDYFARRAQG